MNFTNTYELTEKAMKPLSRIKENNKKDANKNKILNEMKIPLLTTNKSITSEEYDDKMFIRKINIDKNVYEKLLAKLNESQTLVANGIIKELNTNIKEIYQLANIKPRVFGFIELNIDSCKEDLMEESVRIIKEHFDRTYYSLTTREREKKYKDNVITMSHAIISENTDIDTNSALDFSYKAILVKNLLKKVNFPYLAESKIKELLESDLYKEFFDSERLHILFQEFDSKLNDLSKIISISL